MVRQPKRKMTQDETKPSDTIQFPIADLDRCIVDLIPDMPKPAKWPAFNSIRHLNRAWKIKEIDPQMALFRAITAEEEAATALFLSLKRRGYDGAGNLKKHDHVHKNAVIPVFDAITRVIAKVGSQMPPTEIFLDTNIKPPQLAIRFKYTHPLTGEHLLAHPQPPLHFSISGGPTDGEMRREDFSMGIDEIVSGTNVKNITDFLKKRANLRNQILYAGPDGYPSIEGDIERSLQEYKRNVFIILRMYLLIEPHKEKQLFVEQALFAFLKTLNKLPNNLESKFS